MRDYNDARTFRWCLLLYKTCILLYFLLHAFDLVLQTERFGCTASARCESRIVPRMKPKETASIDRDTLLPFICEEGELFEKDMIVGDQPWISRYIVYTIPCLILAGYFNLIRQVFHGVTMPRVYVDRFPEIGRKLVILTIRRTALCAQSCQTVPLTAYNLCLVSGISWKYHWKMMKCGLEEDQHL